MILLRNSDICVCGGCIVMVLENRGHLDWRLRLLHAWIFQVKLGI